MFTDMLGSVRAVTDGFGQVVECYDYEPFGRLLSAGDNGRGTCYPVAPDTQLSSRVPQKFTGKERDAETGLDFFLARYYSGAQGRFLSPDEFKGGIVDPFTGKQISQLGPLPYADIRDPQTLNKYAYVRNNPLRYIDPDGHMDEEHHASITEYAANEFGYSDEAIAIMVKANASVDLPWNQLNNPDHGMSDSGINRTEALKRVNARIDAAIDSAVEKASKNDAKGALKMLGKATHTTQDLVGHNLVTLAKHGMKESPYQTPEKVAVAVQETKKILQRFETTLSKKVGQKNAAKMIQRVKKAGEDEE